MVTKKKTWLQLVIGRQISGHKKKAHVVKWTITPISADVGGINLQMGVLSLGPHEFFVGQLVSWIQATFVPSSGWNLGRSNPFHKLRAAAAQESKENQQIFRPHFARWKCSPKPPRRSDISPHQVPESQKPQQIPAVFSRNSWRQELQGSAAWSFSMVSSNRPQRAPSQARHSDTGALRRIPKNLDQWM